MAPVPLTPLSEESLPNYTAIKVQAEPLNKKEDRGCLFFYNSPEVRGTFAEDNFFRTARKNYERTFEDMIGRSRMEVPCLPEDKSTPEMTDAGDHFQIVVDVAGYSPSDIHVKAVGDQELLIEGRRVDNRPDGSAVNVQFNRRFVLPRLVELDRVTSGLSSDGMLTVRAPKSKAASNCLQDKGLPRYDNGAPRKFSEESHRDSPFNKSIVDFDNFVSDVDLESRMKHQMGFSEPLPIQIADTNTKEMVENENDFVITLNIKGYNPQDISVKALGDQEILIEGKHVEKNESGNGSNRSFSRKFGLSKLVKLNEIRSSLSKDGVLTITAPKMKTDPKTAPSPKSSIQTSHTTTGKQFSNATIPFQNDPMDDFFNRDFDSAFNHRNTSSRFMEDARNDYNNSLKQMGTNNWMFSDHKEPEFFSPAATQFSIEPERSSAASNITDNEKDYQMKLDVSGYKPEEISVKSVGDLELLVEGKHTGDKSAGPAITKTFTRRFVLPGLAKMDSVRTLLSSDGTLTITAPKKGV